MVREVRQRQKKAKEKEGYRDEFGWRRGVTGNDAKWRMGELEFEEEAGKAAGRHNALQAKSSRTGEVEDAVDGRQGEERRRQRHRLDNGISITQESLAMNKPPPQPNHHHIQLGRKDWV